MCFGSAENVTVSPVQLLSHRLRGAQVFGKCFSHRHIHKGKTRQSKKPSAHQSPISSTQAVHQNADKTANHQTEEDQNEHRAGLRSGRF